MANRGRDAERTLVFEPDEGRDAIESIERAVAAAAGQGVAQLRRQQIHDRDRAQAQVGVVGLAGRAVVDLADAAQAAVNA